MKCLFLKVQKPGLVLTLLATLAGAHPLAAQTFVLSSSPGVGFNPIGVTVADVNGDGWCDGSDVALVFNNNQTGAGKITPATTPDYRLTGKRKHKTVNNPTKIQ